MPRPYPDTSVRHVSAHVRKGRPVRAYNRRVRLVKFSESNTFDIVDPDTGRRVGTTSLWPGEDPDYLEVSNLFIDEPQQGKGFGSAALREIERLAAKEGFSGVALIDPTFRGRLLYKKSGYRDEPGDLEEVVVMRKEL